MYDSGFITRTITAALGLALAVYLIYKIGKLAKNINAMKTPASAGANEDKATASRAIAGASLSGNMIETWDVFDTLIARYCKEPAKVFSIVADRIGVAEFPVLRVRAQHALDQIGAPYRITDIYRKIQDYGISSELAHTMMQAELAVELDQVIPIRRNLERIGRADILVSDMYLPGEFIADLMSDASAMPVTRPLVVGNWGKSSGEIWPLLQSRYQIAAHHGDNSHADGDIPNQAGLATEIVDDHHFTDWERLLCAEGSEEFALLLRECRLRSVPVERDVLHDLVCGPYLTLLLTYAITLRNKYHATPTIAFCSRDCDQLASVFRALYPEAPCLNVDMNRRLAYFGKHDAFFNSQLPDGAVIVDFLSSGRSVLGYLQRNPEKKAIFNTFIYLDERLNADERSAYVALVNEGIFAYQHELSDFTGRAWSLEILLQTGYDRVVDVVPAPGSGAVIRQHAEEEWSEEERRFLDFKQLAVRNLTRCIKRRGWESHAAPEQIASIAKRAAAELLLREEALRHATTFSSRENALNQELQSATREAGLHFTIT